MTSTVKVDNVQKTSDSSNIIKKCGTTTTIGSGASNPIVVDGSAVTIGRCGGTVALASGASQTGFGQPGQLVDWQTSIKTSGFTATSGEGYFCNTTSGGFTVTLPASPSVGSIIAVKDYANTFNSNNLILGRNGVNIGGQALDSSLSEDGLATTLVYADATKGWLVVNSGLQSEAPGPQYVAAGGGTESTVGDYKIHIFTGPGTFTVSNAGNGAGNNKVDYLVVAGGGGGEDANGAGGGAGGYRESVPSPAAWTASPTASPGGGITVCAAAYSIVVGGGGSNGPTGSAGSTSSFSSITSAGGGGGGPTSHPEADGGSGAGGPHSNPPGPGVGQGNTPPVSPPQGNNGGTGIDNKSGPNGTKRGGSGGGATAVGGSRLSPGPANTQNPTADQAGGAGATSCITNSPVARGGGGGGGAEQSPGMALVVAPGGLGGGGAGGLDPGGTAAVAGTANTGGGGGGGGDLTPTTGKAGGSGIVVIRYKFQN